MVALDFDGTLADIVPDPDQARAHPGAVPALSALAPEVDSVAVITGRPAGVAVRYGGFAGGPGLEHMVVLGHYGAERWDAVSGIVHAPAEHPGRRRSGRSFRASWTRSVPGAARRSRRRAGRWPSTPAGRRTRRRRSLRCGSRWPIWRHGTG
ncbi:hypothetical protein SAVIM40S_05355 [Streptomyces avidinii]